jgi:hypothetical protein
MNPKRRFPPLNVYIIFTDIALLMLTMFIFLLVTILMTSRMVEEKQLPKLKNEVAALQQALNGANADKLRLLQDVEALAGMTSQSQMERALAAAGLEKGGKNRKDFDLFVLGLKQLPGKTLHVVVDASGSMHGVSTFLIPVLRVMVIRSGKQLSAVTWFSDGAAETYTGTMAEMLDRLMQDAPFIGSEETIGHAFRHAAQAAPKPGAYLLIGDEPSSDRISYFNIPSPVFTMTLGRDNPDAIWEYETLAKETGGRMLRLEFRD